LDEGEVKAQGNYDELQNSGIDITAYVPQQNSSSNKSNNDSEKVETMTNVTEITKISPVISNSSTTDEETKEKNAANADETDAEVFGIRSSEIRTTVVSAE
jgi:hypothetical protein